ncbi:hypothetical protein Cgig2_003224 [Carnegiea gigantea]|uniref:Uncharacterized protein n=1 Tax=Carnegiea gigantea TaxID=171969 RepID=A0A9Q1JU33_9CARY|nr:hypothetical protein Cgig2_003224 [Carnegiea gigantea]
MSWLRTAVSKAVEVGNKNNITRTVRSYADSVVQQAGQAVAEGAKLLQDRIGVRNQKSAKHAAKRLEEAAITCRGLERIQLLRRWLILLKEIEKMSGDSKEDNAITLEQHLTSVEDKDNTRKPSLVSEGCFNEFLCPTVCLSFCTSLSCCQGLFLSRGYNDGPVPCELCACFLYVSRSILTLAYWIFS